MIINTRNKDLNPKIKAGGRYHLKKKQKTVFDNNGGNARNTPRVPWRCRFAFDMFSGGDCGSIAFKALLPGALLIGGMAMSKYHPKTRKQLGAE